MAMEFRLLGGVEARCDGRQVELGHSRQRAALAVLAVEAGDVVTVEQLVDRIWGETAGPRSRDNLYTYISRLRRAFVEAVGEPLIERRRGGYRLSVRFEQIDLHRFRSLAGDPDEAEAALQAWQGEPFDGLDVPWLQRVADSLNAQHHATRLAYFDTELRRGRHETAVPGLLELAAEYPGDERGIALAMLALYRSGRQAEALERYERLRVRLADDLGIDPGQELKDLYRRILRSDDGLGVVWDAEPAVPRQLPAPTRMFVARREELAQLDNALDPEQEAALWVVNGPGGMGKTWLVVQWAHSRADRFPDGQLYLNLRGFDPDGTPLSPESALRTLLEGLGVDSQTLPATIDGLSGLFRSMTSSRRILVILDNAADAEQVAPLLPGGDKCVTIVTSRRELTGLVVSRGARPLPLSMIDDSAAERLFVKRLGSARTRAEPWAVARLIARCGGLPLALGILAARASGQPKLPLSMLVDQIEDDAHRLDALESDDLSVGLRATLDGTVRALEPRAAQLFALLGLAPGSEHGVSTVAALAGVDVADARRLLKRLENAHLIERYRPDRYRMHDLTYLYARHHVAAALDGSTSHPARLRLVDFYLHTAKSALMALHPHDSRIEFPAVGAGCTPLQHDADSALGWYGTEYANLRLILRFAAEQHMYRHTWLLAWTIGVYPWLKGLVEEGRECWTIGLSAAQRIDDPAGLLKMHRYVSDASCRTGDYERALSHLRQASHYARLLDDQREVHLLQRLSGVIKHDMGDYPAAIEAAEAALESAVAMGEHRLSTRALNAIGWYQAKNGDLDGAYKNCARALARLDDCTDPGTESFIRDSLGYILRHKGDFAAAIHQYELALAQFKSFSHAYHEAEGRKSLAEVYAANGDLDIARRHWRRALELYRGQGRTVEAELVAEILAEN